MLSQQTEQRGFRCVIDWPLIESAHTFDVRPFPTVLRLQPWRTRTCHQTQPREKRRRPAAAGTVGSSGLAAARARGRVALDEWVAEGIVLPGPASAKRRGGWVGQLAVAVRQGQLFSKTIRGRRYYVAALLEIGPDAAASVCRALGGLDDSEKAIFWLRKHGALGGRTVVEAIRDVGLDRVVQLALAKSAQARLAQRSVRGSSIDG